MRVSIERLRKWLLVGAALLVIVIAGFLEFAHLRAHRFLKNLPSRLGVDISRESNGYTYSQSSRGKTVYTIHAAHVVQRKDGKTLLHDVGIVLYGQKGDRADRIYGSEFEYDQKSGVVRAVGEVHLDLQAPAPTDARGRTAYASGHDEGRSKAAHGDEHAGADERMVHVKTSGLVFVQSLGIASTDQEIEFEYHGMNGRAKGADYNSDTGLTVLQSEVRVSGLRDGEPALLTASHAEFDRTRGQVQLAHAHYFTGGDAGKGSAGGRVMAADQAVIQLRSDGSPDNIFARGDVSVEQGGGVLRGQVAKVFVTVENRPVMAQMEGGLSYTSDGALRTMQGRAERGTIHFDGKGRAETAVIEENAEVHLREREDRALPWSERTVSGARLETHFESTGGKEWMRDGTVSGAARLLLVDRSMGSRALPREAVSDLRGDLLTAQMERDGRAERLVHLSGKGHTSLDRHDDTGAVDTSRGDTLEVSFKAPPALPGGGRGAAKSTSAGSSLSRAVQAGSVSLTHLPARRPGEATAPVLTRATGAEAAFDEDGQTLTIRGQVQVTQGDDLVRAELVTLHRTSGDASATGHVEMSYRQTPTAEPVHVRAARAEFEHVAGHGTFYGDEGMEARLWQGGSQVEAPVIELRQAEKSLSASIGDRPSQRVKTVLAGATKNGAGRPQVMRIASRTLHYSDADRRAQFGGGVDLEEADGTIRAADVVALLTPSSTGHPVGGVPSAGTQAAFLGGSVDRVTATGDVTVSEPGRRVMGDRLVYTAVDGRFLMTGTPSVPPRVEDEAQGTITGAALEFHAGDNSVMIVGDGKVGKGRRVRTETLVRQP